ncbi:MAG: thiamine-phosphate kinase [Phycisphaerae bacterium]|nr:thiamine-phosphate kinase [Phycisphaerae bacterium]MDW8263483.1 thiamine-phosphate kinase [Phycisphaerales bacterium]
MASEFDFIDWIRSRVPASEAVCIPPGDDLAGLRWNSGELLLCGTDQVLDGVHFDANLHAPLQIGRKAMNRNLSDCAAMACLPAAGLATLTLPRGRSIEYAKELFRGIEQAARDFDCPIVGGDTAVWDGKLAICVSILGRSAGLEPVRRSGAQEGDRVYVSGALGGSWLGRHMAFEPRVKLARTLRETGLITAMIDISDGLSRDLGHICRESGVGAVVFAEKIPIHEDAVRAAQDGTPALFHALHDGEDYELLFTAPATAEISSAVAIGRITRESGLWLQHPDGRREPLKPLAWEHRFQPSSHRLRRPIDAK